MHPPAPTTYAAARDDRASVDKALGLLEALAASGPASLTSLSRRVALPKSTASRILSALQRRGAVARADNEYSLGPLMLQMHSRQQANEHDHLRERLTPALARLYECTRHTVHLSVLAGAQVLCLNKIAGDQQIPLRSRAGGFLPAHSTAAGKVLLARDEDALAAVAEGGLAGLTQATLTDLTKLENTLRVVRERGIAFDDQETVEGVSCVAAPIVDLHGETVAALSISTRLASVDARVFAPQLRRVCFAASRTNGGLSRPVTVREIA